MKRILAPRKSETKQCRHPILKLYVQHTVHTPVVCRPFHSWAAWPSWPCVLHLTWILPGVPCWSLWVSQAGDASWQELLIWFLKNSSATPLAPWGIPVKNLHNISAWTLEHSFENSVEAINDSEIPTFNKPAQLAQATVEQHECFKLGG